MPSLKRWKSVPMMSLLGARMLLYRHQKSSTVLKVYTLRRVCPQVACFCLPLGLSNQSVQVCSRGCFWLKSGVDSVMFVQPRVRRSVSEIRVQSRARTHGDDGSRTEVCGNQAGGGKYFFAKIAIYSFQIFSLFTGCYFMVIRFHLSRN